MFVYMKFVGHSGPRSSRRYIWRVSVLRAYLMKFVVVKPHWNSFHFWSSDNCSNLTIIFQLSPCLFSICWGHLDTFSAFSGGFITHPQHSLWVKDQVKNPFKLSLYFMPVCALSCIPLRFSLTGSKSGAQSIVICAENFEPFFVLT